MASNVYTSVWSKYRPVILKMMLNSSEEQQEYKMLANEFKALNARQKGGYTFQLQVSKGRALNNIKESIVAQDLLEVLQLSPKASELMEEAPYEITLDKQFMLHVSRLN